MNDKIETDVFDSIEQISPESWDSVAGESIGINHAMLQCIEKNFTGTGKPRYFRVGTSDRAMAVSVAVIENDADRSPLTSRLFGRLAPKLMPIFRSLDRALVCGRFPGGGAAVVTRDDADEKHWVRVICGAMEDYARSYNLTMAYTSVLPEQSLLRRELLDRRYLRGIDLPIATLNVTWHDTQSYLKTLRARKKAYAETAKKEMRHFHKSGTSISRFVGTDYTKLYELLRQHDARKNATYLQFGPDFLKDLATQLGDDCIVYVARRAAILTGVCVILRRHHKAWAWLVGIDHEADANSFSYFNLTYYHPCSQFPELGIREAHFGNALQHLKYRRGCDIVDADFFAKATSSEFNVLLQPIFTMHRAYFRKKFRAALHPGTKHIRK